MTTLVFLACLITSDHCQVVERPWPGPSFACTLHGQQEIARWLAEQPGWELRGGYKCVLGQNI